MNRALLILASCIIVSITGKGQTINSVFVDMPSNIIYGLTVDMKESLLETPNDTTKFVSTAIYQKISRKTLNDNFISLQTSGTGTTQIKLLPLINGSKIVCLVQSVCGTICDSRISFYTEKWEAIDRAELFPERQIEWFVKEDADKESEKYGHAISSLTMLPMKYTLSPDENTISVEFDPKGFLPTELYKAIEPFLTQSPKVLEWDKVRFK